MEALALKFDRLISKPWGSVCHGHFRRHGGLNGFRFCWENVWLNGIWCSICDDLCVCGVLLCKHVSSANLILWVSCGAPTIIPGKWWSLEVSLLPPAPPCHTHLLLPGSKQRRLPSQTETFLDHPSGCLWLRSPRFVAYPIYNWFKNGH